MSGEILVVRHGQTEANAKGLLLGHLDVDLDDVGRAQAEALAAALPRPDVVISSPLARTRQTAAAFGQEIEVVDDWIELDYGEWDGRPTAEISAETWRAWREDVDFSPPGGESLGRLTARVHDALDGLAAELDDRRVVVVTHVSPIKAALAWALDLGPETAWRAFVAPASVTRIGVADPSRPPILRGFNETTHLADIRPA